MYLKKELPEIKDDLESLNQMFKSLNYTILTNPTPIQINGATPTTHTLQEESNESDKNTIMNLCKFIVDCELTWKSTRLGKKKERKIRSVKIVPRKKSLRSD